MPDRDEVYRAIEVWVPLVCLCPKIQQGRRENLRGQSWEFEQCCPTVREIGVSTARSFPNLSVVSHSASPFSYSGFLVKKIIRQQKNVALTQTSHPCSARSKGIFARKRLRSTSGLQMAMALQTEALHQSRVCPCGKSPQSSCQTPR